MDKHTALKQYFGHAAFRQGQEELIDALLAGRDVLGVMPTGAGKSACYQVPALLLDGVTLVVSPLISLMKDQVAALSQAGVNGAFINSSLSAAQCREVFRRAEGGAYKIIYVAPERLETESFLQFAEHTHISLVAVDEAHCVSQWGQDFRPSYMKIVDFVDKLSYRPAVGAFTATATAEVKEDIVRMLRLREPLVLTTGFDRPNLFFRVVKPQSKLPWLEDYIARQGEKSGIIYAATRKAVEAVCAALCAQGIPATRYHAGLGDGERRQNQEDFVYDRARVMVATNAFGMGIDKSNVSFVVHYNMPKNVESYYQEAGRAGRDGEEAECVLLFSAGDVQTAKFLIRNAEENQELSAAEREAVLRRDLERLDRMVGYCKTVGCLRAYMLAYFGEDHPGNCENCSNCKGQFLRQDITTSAQKILSAVARVEKKFSFGLGTVLIVRMLHGSKEQRIIQLGLNAMPTYGLMRDTGRQEIRAYIDQLVALGYLALTQGEYPVLTLTPKAGDVLFRGERVLLSQRVEPETPAEPQREKRRARASTGPAVADESLLAVLKALRTELAQKENVPAYIVFSNAALADMSDRAPRTMEAFLQVSGVGQVKAKRYGKAFLEAIRAYCES